MTDLPSFDKYAGSRTEQNHPAGIFVVINQIEQDDDLHENVRNNLFKQSIKSNVVKDQKYAQSWK